MTHSPSAVQTYWMETLQAGLPSSATLTLQATAPMLGNSNRAITKRLLSDGVNSWEKKARIWNHERHQGKSFYPFALHSFRCCLGLEWPQMRGSCPCLFSQIHLHQLKEFTAVQESFFF